MTRVAVFQECPDPSWCLREETENAHEPTTTTHPSSCNIWEDDSYDRSHSEWEQMTPDLMFSRVWCTNDTVPFSSSLTSLSCVRLHCSQTVHTLKPLHDIIIIMICFASGKATCSITYPFLSSSVSLFCLNEMMSLLSFFFKWCATGWLLGSSVVRPPQFQGCCVSEAGKAWLTSGS